MSIGSVRCFSAPPLRFSVSNIKQLGTWREKTAILQLRIADLILLSRQTAVFAAGQVLPRKKQFSGSE